MPQLRIPFPGEEDHVGRLLSTAGSLIAAGKLRSAYEVLELAERQHRDEADTPRLHALYGWLAEVAIRAAERDRSAAAQPTPRLARVLPFGEVRSAPARASRATSSAS